MLISYAISKVTLRLTFDIEGHVIHIKHLESPESLICLVYTWYIYVISRTEPYDRYIPGINIYTCHMTLLVYDSDRYMSDI
jgi:hypothetical protein